MNKKHIIRTSFFGLLSWLIPFVISIFFYDRQGHLSIDETFFKSIMVVVGSGVGVALLVKYFSSLEKTFLKHAVWVGLSWLIINLVLDSLILIPLLKVDFGSYLMQIGLRYLTIPITSIGIGYLLQKQRHT